MRLSQQQVGVIKAAVARVVGERSRVWLFGSRADDTLRGGDIDLFIETDDPLPNPVQVLGRLEGELVRGLGDRKIDTLLHGPGMKEAPIHRAAREKGVLL